MSLHGHTKIELTNVKTGEKEVVEKDNTITNCISEILNGINHLSKYPLHNTGTSIYTVVNENLPLISKVFGGVVLFEDAIASPQTTTFQPADNVVVGSASTTYAETNSWRGSLNANESGVVYDGSIPIGYKYVWDFGTDKANGTISSLGLTSTNSGTQTVGCSAANALSTINPNAMHSKFTTLFNLNFNTLTKLALYIDGNDVYYVEDGTNTVLRKRSLRQPTNITLNQSWSMWTDEVVVKTFSYSIIYAGIYNNNFYVVTSDTSNYIVHLIDKSTWDETTVTIPKLATYSVSRYAYDGNYLYTFYCAAGSSSITVRRIDKTTGELIDTTTKTGLYHNSNVSLISGVISYGDYIAVLFSNDTSTASAVFVNTKTYEVGVDRDSSNIIYAYYNQHQGSVWGRGRQVICNNVPGVYNIISHDRYSNNSSYSSFNSVYKTLVRDYLLTVQNLEASVTKTAEKTMKVTYTITDSTD